MKRNLLITSLILILSGLSAQNIRTLGDIIVDENQNEIILKGIGLGGWMLQEGYMMNSNGAADTQHEFKEKLTALVGVENTTQFYDDWLANFVTESDIDSIASWGFNSVRVAMHYNLFTLPIEEEPVAGQNTWLNKGFDMIDDLLTWCTNNQIYLILDLHAAPGGQGSDAAISDYDPDKPSLWESVENQNKTIALWGQLADRYKDEPYIGGYGLLNEINWWPMPAGEPRNLFVAITNAIRAVDQEHIIFIGGNSWSNDYTTLTPPWDANMAYEFHKYWSYTDSGSLNFITSLRDTHNVPIWCGETGENSNVWYRDAMNLYETNGIGWSMWPYKRIATTVAPYSIPSNSNYEAIISYWKGEGPAPSVSEAMAGLNQLTTDILSQNNTYYKDVVDALIRQPGDHTNIPYTTHNVPGTVFLSDFDLGTNGVAYYDADYVNYSLSTGEYQAWNKGWSYRNDGVDIETSLDPLGNGYHIAHTEDGEWLKYTLNVEESGFYNISMRYASTQSGGRVQYAVNDNVITEEISLYNTGGWNSFTPHYINNVYLEAGNPVFKVQVVGGIAFNMSRLDFSVSNDPPPQFQAMGALTATNEKSINLSLNQPVTTTTIDNTAFEVLVNGAVVAVESVSVDPNNSLVIIINLENYLFYQDNISLNHGGNLISALNNAVLGPLNDFPVENNLTERFYVPGLIQAESFTFQSGLDTESTTDSGGGANVGWTDSNDYAEYPVYISTTGIYDLDLRLAAQNQSGSVRFSLIGENGTQIIGNFSTPVTGGWQSWFTMPYEVSLEAGIYTLRMTVVQGGFNINWFEFIYSDTNLSDGPENATPTAALIYPNPAINEITIATPGIQIHSVYVHDIYGRVLLQKINLNSATISMDLHSISSGAYFVKIHTSQGLLTKPIIKN